MPQNLQHFEDVPSTCSKLFLYWIEFVYKRASEKKFKSEFHVFGWFPGLQNLAGFFGKFFVELVWNTFSGGNNSRETPVFGFSNSLPYGLEESRELWILISWVWVRSSRMQKKFCQQYYGFTDYFEMLTFGFSNITPRGVSTCKLLLFYQHF